MSKKEKHYFIIFMNVIYLSLRDYMCSVFFLCFSIVLIVLIWESVCLGNFFEKRIPCKEGEKKNLLWFGMVFSVYWIWYRHYGKLSLISLCKVMTCYLVTNPVDKNIILSYAKYTEEPKCLSIDFTLLEKLLRFSV